jgi:hypothetical protein
MINCWQWIGGKHVMLYIASLILWGVFNAYLLASIDILKDRVRALEEDAIDGFMR